MVRGFVQFMTCHPVFVLAFLTIMLGPTDGVPSGCG